MPPQLEVLSTSSSSDHTHIASDLEGARVKARSLFDVGTLNMPQNPDGLRILDEDGNEVFFWTPGIDDS
jgi:hypothetical protein